MKEVIVHTPTLELAKEVLKIAKEQGFRTPTLEVEYYFKIEGNLLCVRFYKDYYSFASKDFYEKEGYKVITADEFLSRYEPKFKPIAMICSREQFEAIRPKLEKLGEIGKLIDAFDKHEYLTNNYNIGCKLFDFIDDSSDWVDFHENNVHHEFDEPVFLNHCGYIEEEPTELEQLRKENAELKKKLNAIENQPKEGDVCLFWDDDKHAGFCMYVLTDIKKDTSHPYYTPGIGSFRNCEKATPENIKKAIGQIKLNSK